MSFSVHTASPSHTTSRILVYLACLCIATAYGLFFTLPLYVKALGGNEAIIGNILFSGAFGTLLCVGFANQIMELCKPHIVVTGGSLFYALGAAVFAFSQDMSALYYVAGFLLGAGWGLTFTIGPIMLSELVTDANRAVLFSVLSAFNALGMGLAPVAAREFLAYGVPHWLVFTAAVVLALISAMLFYSAGRTLPHMVALQRRSLPGGETDALHRITRSPAKYPLIMVFLGACIFSSMVNFQTTFAASKELNYSIFYVSYTAAVIGARFLISGFVNRKEPMKTTVVLLGLMCVSLIMFATMSASPALYAASSMLLGLSYGLAYPLIQAQAVNATHESLRSRVLVYFSLCYFVGVFGFPLLGGQIIVEGGYRALLYTLLIMGVMELLVAVWRYLVAPRADAVSDNSA
ncbi:MFS transporter [Pseudochrobactrum asaccharolyticum]|uniref:Putative MFS family arabinose efflux permease n=1 Tax=Pseudochrobactrum asaccharolyticum TaxID=354351 RepID=A0A366E230_9HYPH|nr:MFS transporter [Pseudochrobactrum asaccharolyticum]RBO95478.1 putative MFS family arabinose efflux permease [Pseudochrobactrum asaccharolyticum]